ncbi:hypothetical protein [Methylobacter sp. S3L5C]|uniref:hypothetical protein n=1 Tax=Methylobacter sp. S3L5C TaxID=2839024 RepID=UPI001FAE585C|nr:hypothetical protein [Methylobacter sp. S3L5C]UOA08270.1 hypothetical protein KKZ03_19020 [Methylobacter sp. S3L5C]
MSKPNTKLLNNQQIFALIGIAVCCGLLILAVPRFIASLYALYPEAAFKQMPQTLPTEVYEKSIADLSKALSWYQNPDYWQTQGGFYLQLFNNRPLQTPAQKQAYLKQAKTAITRGLSLSPVDPRGWLQLAVVDSLLKMPKQQIISALRLSFYAGRVEPELVIPRLRFSYTYYADFTEDMQQLWQKQIPVAWAFKAPQLVKFITAHPEAKQPALKAFIYSPEEADKFLSRFK